MRKELNIFIDPYSGLPLELKIEKERSGHVIDGCLRNRKHVFPIIRGIPRFVKRECSGAQQTAGSFGVKWQEKRSRLLGNSIQDIRMLKEQLIAVLGCQTMAQAQAILDLSRAVLNAGCGVAWSEPLCNRNRHTQRHCIDLSLSVETAFKNTRHFPNVMVAQASIFELPYADEAFDLIYSIGVIHHTPDPRKAFGCLAGKLKPGGLLGVYIYNQKPLLRELADVCIRSQTTRMDYDDCMRFAEGMTMLGESFAGIKKSLRIKKDIPLLGIKKGKYDLHRFVYDHFIKCWYNKKMDKEYARLVNQDWYHPFYASHHTKEEVVRWFKDAGIENTRSIQPKGWEHSGYFISGRKK